MDDKITVILTHYKRLDLLQQTIDSFTCTNMYPIDEFIIIDDSAEKYYNEEVIRLYGNIANIIINENNLGQKRSIDKLIDACNNEYIFHLEEDWLFDGKSKKYIENSLLILKNKPEIHQVHVRHHNDCVHPVIGDVQYINDVSYKFLDPNFRDAWNGFSFNPGLRRKSDINKMFPNGLEEFEDELQAALHTRQFDYRAVRLEDTVCRHIGWHNRTQIGGRGF